MGQRDLVTNKCLSNAERYADLINGIVFGGEEIIHSEDLQEVDSKSIISKWLYKHGYKSHQMYRDIVKKAAIGMNFAIIGVENQDEVHYLMPLRIMAYDVAEYEKQAVKIRRLIRKRKKISPAEFLSGFGKTDRLHPCITIVLFYGEEWDGSIELHELLDFSDIPRELKAYVNNYKVHMVNMSKWENTEVFKTDLKQIFGFLRCRKDKDKIRELTEQDPAFQEMEEDAYDMIAEYTSSSILKNIKKEYRKEGKVNMCKGLRDWMEEEQMHGAIQAARALGADEQKAKEMIMLQFSFKENLVEEYMEKYWNAKC